MVARLTSAQPRRFRSPPAGRDSCTDPAALSWAISIRAIAIVVFTPVGRDPHRSLYAFCADVTRLFSEGVRRQCIYYVDAFEQALGGRMPTTILSHDLWRAVMHARLVSTAVLRGLPARYRRRQASAPWIARLSLLRGCGAGPRNPVPVVKESAVVRSPVKLADNLRRSLVRRDHCPAGDGWLLAAHPGGGLWQCCRSC